MRSRACKSALGLVGLVGLATICLSALKPVDAHMAEQSDDAYAWRVFVAVNQVCGSAVPNSDQPAAWETWATRNDILREDGADPGRWKDLKAGTTAPGRFEVLSAKDLPNLRHIEGGKMVAGTDSASAAARLTEIRFNHAAFDYIREQQLYSLHGQLQRLKAHAAVEFPVSTKTIKARWRPITEADRSRYHTLDLQRADGTYQLYGLVALHIATKDLRHWFWATFEHEDNATRPGAEPWLAASRDTFACPAAQPDCNRAPSGIGLEGTVWSHYRLRGTMTRYTDEAGRPRLLANSDLEAGIQASSSCMTCHARAARGVVHGTPIHLPIFDSTGDPTQRRGFVGTPQAAWYRAASANAQAAVQFQPLDFVWSLALLPGPR